MVEQLSPLGTIYRHGAQSGTPRVTLTELQPGSIVQVAAWRGQEELLRREIRDITGHDLPNEPGGGMADGSSGAFGIGPSRFLLHDQEEGLGEKMKAAVLADTGMVTDLSHGRTALRINGEKAEWVLSKLFAIDFAAEAFPIGHARTTMHHDIFANIQRSGGNQFDLFVFRSFARSFWRMLIHAAEECGYEVR